MCHLLRKGPPFDSLQSKYLRVIENQVNKSKKKTKYSGYLCFRNFVVIYSQSMECQNDDRPIQIIGKKN